VPITSGSVQVESIRNESLLGQDIDYRLRIKNQGPTLSVNGLTLRYYYRAESSNQQDISCNFLLDANCGNVTLSVATLTPSCSNATHVANIRFTASGSLGTGQTLSVEGKISEGLLVIENYSNDYSRPESALSYNAASNVTLSRNNQLIWGVPPCGCGNGVRETGEQCDHAGTTAYCNANCTTSRCGDGIINTLAGENCDRSGPTLDCGADCKSTGFPTSAASALVLWLDATQGASIVKSTQVGTWMDRSGKNHHVTQAIAASQPLWIASAIGSKPAMYFDGTSSELVSDAAVLNASVASAIIVHRVEPFGTEAIILGNGSAGSGGGFAIRTQPTQDSIGLSFAATTGYSLSNWNTIGGSPVPGLSYVGWNSTDVTWVRGGTSSTISHAASYLSTSALLKLGGVSGLEPYRGYLGEVMLFNRELTISERNAILSQLQAKWLP
jgi:hypothetical protein